jgi:signal transduction histidine kinase
LCKQQDRIRQLTDQLNSLPTGADERRITSAIVGRSWLFANMHRDNVVTDRQQRNLDAIENCAEHLLAIVNDFLDLADVRNSAQKLVKVGLLLRFEVDSPLNLPW